MKLQFDIFSLFVLTTVVAMACGIAGLPIPLSPRMFSIAMLAICYYGWLVRNYKYPDPRKPQPVSQVSRARAYLIPLVFEAVYGTYILSTMPRTPHYRWLWWSVVAYCSASILVRLWLAFKPDPKSQPATSS